MDISSAREVLSTLIRCASVTPSDGGSLDLIESWLQNMGFITQRLVFGEGKNRVDNLYARYGKNAGGLLFLGHVDVVPPGNFAEWTKDPFGAEICEWGDEGEVMVGRGAVDMKGGVAAYIAALSKIAKGEGLDTLGMPLGFFVTSDEEGVAVNGTKKSLQHLWEQGERWDFCLNGEPTSRVQLGDLIKVGRRGSLCGDIEVQGTQGHTGYVALADNALHRLIRLLSPLLNISLDKGTKYFEPSTLSVTNIAVDNEARNVVPGVARGYFNIRFNDTHTEESLTALLENVLLSVGEPRDSYKLRVSCNAESFLTTPEGAVQKLSQICKDVLGIEPRLGTDGGTSDSRFANDYVAVADFGVTGKTMHAVNERISLLELEQVCEIYQKFIVSYARGPATCG